MASWGSSIIAKSPSESIADSGDGGPGRFTEASTETTTDQRQVTKFECPPEDELHPRILRTEEGYLNYCKRILWPSSIMLQY